MKKYYTIPFFIPHRACPFKCIFCDQKKIIGSPANSAEIYDIALKIPETVEKYLSTMRHGTKTHIEIGFFGGTFTGLNEESQKILLTPAYQFVQSKKIFGIRLSTRPDFIDQNKLKLLKNFGITTIELGIQSMSDSVLRASKRGYTAKDAENASKLIITEGFNLGHQIMLGLPESSFEDEYNTVMSAVKLKALEVRIYPLIVIEGTEIALLWKEKKYLPLTMEEAVSRSTRLLDYLYSNNIKVIRCGLHPSETLLKKENILAGPFHPSFRQKAESKLFGDMLKKISLNENIISVHYNPNDEQSFYGFQKYNHDTINQIKKKNIQILKDRAIPVKRLGYKTQSEIIITA
ncbi:oxygen-independent coproporphyrinogen III oxidase [Candidatus Omnitrophus magneticus]|uniref:Oxygen-independent coproporphyrinogen III oxidase n=1 Tax=Candidatus Omnitrophus magneticus TaxID=1609969 RepID=A0A0F0CT53_9BACT|nr:oxygen-independent coproporphyrinogen III oxidase [Candidatus Omnitrophus magneticus]